jgi:hypothetical protein
MVGIICTLFPLSGKKEGLAFSHLEKKEKVSDRLEWVGDDKDTDFMHNRQ